MTRACKKPKLRLKVLEGAGEVTVQLSLPAVVGRGSSAKLRVGASTMSRRHCRLFEQDGEILVEDLNSSNGTFVRGTRVAGPTKLKDRDQLTTGLGDFR